MPGSLSTYADPTLYAKNIERALGASASTDLNLCTSNMTTAAAAVATANTYYNSLVAAQAAAQTAYNTALAWDTANRADVPYVICYTDTNRGGSSDVYYAGSYPSAKRNDAYSSVRLSPWAGVTMYKNAIGSTPSVNFKNKSTGFQDNNLTDWSMNDAVSSLVVVDYKDYSNPALTTALNTLNAAKAAVTSYVFPTISAACPVCSLTTCTSYAGCNTAISNCQTTVANTFSTLDKTVDSNVLVLSTTRLTTVSVKMTNNTTANVTYQFKCCVRRTSSTAVIVPAVPTSADVVVLPGASNAYTYTFAGLKQNTSYEFFAVKKIVTATYTAYVDTAPVYATTLKMDGYSYGTSTTMVVGSSVYAMTPHPACKIIISKGTTAPTSSAQFFKTQDVTDSQWSTQNGVDYFNVEVSGLDTDTKYAVTVVSAVELQPTTTPSGITGLTGYYVLNTFYHETVTAAAFGTVKPRASYFVMNWSGNIFQSYTVVDKSTDTSIISAAVNGSGIAKSTLTTLSPATSYTLQLRRKVVSNGMTTTILEDEKNYITSSSNMTLIEQGTTFVSVGWTKAYDGATYCLQYKDTSLSANPMSSTPDIKTDVDLKKTLTALKPNTPYSITLTVKEGGSYVALGSMIMEGGKKFLGDSAYEGNCSDTTFCCGFAAAALVIVAIVLMRED
jgi:hypothetical protein